MVRQQMVPLEARHVSVTSQVSFTTRLLIDVHCRFPGAKRLYLVVAGLHSAIRGAHLDVLMFLNPHFSGLAVGIACS